MLKEEIGAASVKYRLVRYGGMASILGGILLILFALLHPPREVSLAVDSLSWGLEHQLGVAAIVFMLFGLIGLYARQIEQSGTLGFIGFVAAFAGVFLDAYFFPLLAVQAPSIVTDILTANVSGLPAVGLGLSVAAFVVGFMQFGLATMRAGVLPRGGGALLILGGPLFGPGSLLPKTVQTIGPVILGLGLMWLGYAVWSDRSLAAESAAGKQS
jgi:hypothetical protein